MPDGDEIAQQSSEVNSLQPLSYALREAWRSDHPVSAAIVCLCIPFIALVQLAIDATAGLLLVLVLVCPWLALGLAIAAWFGERRSKDVRWRRVHAVLLIAAIEVGLVLWIMIPAALSASPERGKRVACASNLRQIGVALLMYANENKGRYPSSLDLLISTGHLGAKDFICPSTGSKPAEGSTREAVVANFRADPGHCDYVYVGAGLHGGHSAEHIVAYDKHYHPDQGEHDVERIHFLFNDGHVEIIARPQADKIIAELQAGKNPPPSAQ